MSIATALVILSVISAAAFAFYGYETVFTFPPRGEYERYGMSGVRVFVGAAQMFGAAGVLLGLVVRPVGIVAAMGLFIMMTLGLFVRYRIRDAPRLMVPAASLACVNGAIVMLHVL